MNVGKSKVMRGEDGARMNVVLNRKVIVEEELVDQF